MKMRNLLRITIILGVLFYTSNFIFGSSSITEYKIEPSDDNAHNFGYYHGQSVAIDGEYAIVGAYSDDSLGTSAGSAYIFKWNGSSWIEEIKLLASDGVAEDYYGYAVDIEGDYAVVGRPVDYMDGDKPGAVYVYYNNGTTWTEASILSASDGYNDDQFGLSVQINGHYIIIGSPGTSSAAGKAYIFYNNGTSWEEQDILTPDDQGFYDYFGTTVALNDDVAFVGNWYDSDNGSQAGAVYVYDRSGTTWTQSQKIKPTEGIANDNFGYDISFDGTTLAVAAPGRKTNIGKIYIYKYVTATWTLNDSVVGTVADNSFADNVAIDGNYLIAGEKDDDTESTSSGLATVYFHNGTTWGQDTTYIASDAGFMDYFGGAVAIDSINCIIGAYSSGSQGAAYIYSTFEEDTSGSQESPEDTSEQASDSLILLNQGFEGDVTGWSVSDQDQDGYTWGVGTDFAHNGSNSVYVHWNSSGNDDWAITPQIQLPNSNNIKLIFWAKSGSITFLEDFNVKLSTSSSEVTNFTVTIAQETEISNEWTKYEYSLSDYSNQSIYLAIQCVSVDEYYLAVDDIQVISYSTSTSTSESENNNTYDVANEFAINSTMNGSFDGDYDWYKITTPYDGGLKLIIDPSATLDSYMDLYDVDGTSYMVNCLSGFCGGTGEADTTMHLYLKEGTYYIYINGSGTGQYSIKNQFYPTSIPDGNDIEPNDSYEDAVLISINDIATGHIGYYQSSDTDSPDWYKITIPNDGELKLWSNAYDHLDTYIDIYDVNGTSYLVNCLSGYCGGLNESDTTIFRNLKAGTYYIHLNASGYGSYELINSFTPTTLPDGNDTEPNDTYDNAIELTLNSSLTGHIGYYQASSYDDYDWYSIAFEAGEQKIIISPDESLDSYIDLYDINGTSYLINCLSGRCGNAGELDTIVYTITQSGTYYVRVSKSGYGSYTISTESSAAPVEMGIITGTVTDATNGDPISGATVSAGGENTTTDGSGDFRLEVASATSITITATGYNDYENTSISVSEGDSIGLNVPLSPTISGDQIRLILTWGSVPADLDSYLKTPEIEGSEYTIYYSNKGDTTSAPYAILDLDDQNGYGPETVTIQQLMNGTYGYYIRNYSGTDSLSKPSEIQVNIYNNSGLIQTIIPPSSGDGRYWHVCNIDGASGNINIVNEIMDAAPVIEQPSSIAAEFSADFTSGDAPLTVNFTDASTGSITGWSWDFDNDGWADATTQNASETYDTEGIYSVKLIVFDGTNYDTIVKENYITVTAANNGVITGTVTDATNGDPVSGANVSAGGENTTTDASGDFRLEVASATSITISASGYNDYENTSISIASGDSIRLNVPLSPTISGNQIRLVLTWGSVPADLDSYLETPEIDGYQYTIYYSSKGDTTSAPYAILDLDDQNGNGPETVTIQQLQNGTYGYYIRNYSGTDSLSKPDEIQVNIYDNSGLIHTIIPPSDGDGRYWHVCNIDGATGEITIINEIMEDKPEIEQPSPIDAEFTADVTNGEAPLAVKFTDVSTSTNPITSWAWDFDNDGTIDATDQNPEYTYNEAGTYTVALTVSDGTDSDTETKTDYITVSVDTSGTEGLESNILSSYSIYPNPSSEVVYISIDNGFSSLTSIQIISINGSVLFENSVDAGNNFFEIDLSTFGKGMYFLKLIEVESYRIEKLIIK